MNQFRAILLLLAIALVGHAAPIEAPAKFDGKVTVDVPADPEIARLTARVEKLEKEVADLKKQFAAVLAVDVVVGEVKPLGSVIGR